MKDKKIICKSPFVALVVTTLATIAISLYCLSRGWFIIFQNLLYFPIIIACFYFAKKGFAFSVALSFIYLFLTVTFTRDSVVITQALIRVVIFIGIAGFITFLSMRLKRADEESRASEEKYRNLFTSFHDAVLTLEPPTWKFTTANPATLEMFKAKSAEEFLSYEPWKLSPELQSDGRDSIEKAKEMIETAMRKGSHSFDWTHKRINGEEFFANVLLSKVEYGGKVLLNAIVRDITERKKAEELSKELTKQKSAFVANVSHEFKNPLAIIKENLSLVIDGLTGEINVKSKEMLEVAKRNIERLIRLTTDLLDISKIEAGKMELRREKIEIGLLVDEIVANNNRESSKKQLTLKKDIPEDIGSLWGDKDKVTEVIVNLLSNAIKYTPSGGNIVIKLLGADNEMRFEISDTGAGIAKEDIDKLFNKFERILAEKQEGTGLGLSIAKDIVELHKGRIWVESEIGKGSKFIFVLPRDSRDNNRPVKEI